MLRAKEAHLGRLRSANVPQRIAELAILLAQFRSEELRQEPLLEKEQALVNWRDSEQVGSFLRGGWLSNVQYPPLGSVALVPEDEVSPSRS